MTTEHAERAVQKMLGDLAWRGPTGRGMGHVVITRAQAIAVIEAMNHHVPETDKEIAAPGG
jgi:hypothetical protein